MGRMDRPPATAHEPLCSKWIAQCLGGESEHRFFDGSRADVLADGVVWEVEWAKKWKEAPGQAILYRVLSRSLEGGVILLTRRKSTEKLYYLRCLLVCEQSNLLLRTWDTMPGGD